MPRIEQANTALQRVVSEILLSEFEWAEGVFVAVSRVEVTADRSLAKIFITVFPKDKEPSVLRKLRKKKGSIRFLAGKKILARRMPEITLELDTSKEIEAHEEVERLLHEIEKSQQK
jgi:ribosome-binding factor A